MNKDNLTSRSNESVTIFMPTFNSQKYLFEAIESILNQTFSDIRLLIVDGGSSDSTPEIGELFSRRDSRVVCQIRPETTPIQRFNEALKTCTTSYLFLAHADDIQSPRRVERQLQFFRDHPDLVMAGTDTFFWLHDFPRKMLSYSGVATYPMEMKNIYPQLLFWWCFANPTLAFKVDHFRSHNLYMDSSYKFCADYYFYWETAQTGRVGNLDETLIAYRHHSASEGPSNKEALKQEILKIKTKIMEDCGLNKCLSERMKEIYLSLEIERNAIISCPHTLKEYEELFSHINNFLKNNEFRYLNKLTSLYLNQIKAQKKRQSFPFRILKKFWNASKILIPN